MHRTHIFCPRQLARKQVSVGSRLHKYLASCSPHTCSVWDVSVLIRVSCVQHTAMTVPVFSVFSGVRRSRRGLVGWRYHDHLDCIMVCLLGRCTREHREKKGCVHAVRDHRQPVRHHFPDVRCVERTISGMARAIRNAGGTWVLDEFQAGDPEHRLRGVNVSTTPLHRQRFQFRWLDCLHDRLPLSAHAGTPLSKPETISHGTEDILTLWRGWHCVHDRLHVGVFSDFPAFPM